MQASVRERAKLVYIEGMNGKRERRGATLYASGAIKIGALLKAD